MNRVASTLKSMTLNFALLTLFLFCSIGEAHARIHTHMNVLGMEELDFLFKIENPESGKCIILNRDGDVIMDNCDKHFSSWNLKEEAGTGATVVVTIIGDDPGEVVCLIGSKDSVESAKCDKSTEKNWNFMRKDDGYKIQYKKDGTCMEVRPDSNGSNPKLTLEKCKNIKYQKFTLDFAVPPRGLTYRFNPILDDKKCMQAKRNRNDDFVVVAGSCKRGEAVDWHYDYKTYQFQYKDPSSDEKRCLDAMNGRNQAATISKCNADTRSQKWLTNGYYDISIESFDINDFCMELNMVTYKFHLRKCDDTKSDQLFKVEYPFRVSEIE